MFRIMAALVIALVVGPPSGQTPRWAAYYSEEVAAALGDFDLLVLDSDAHPPLAPLIQKQKTLLGYISVGEVEDFRAHFAQTRAAGLLQGENETWKGSFFVDARDPRWRALVISLVRSCLKQGFHGVFLDTVDNAEFLEDKDPRRNQGMKAGMAQIILEIRRQFPTIKIAVNRGFAILPRIDTAIDFVLGESVFTAYDFKTKSHRLAERAAYQEQVNLLQAAKRRSPKLTVLTLDYWNPADAAGISRIYREQRANGFWPYVSTIELNRIVSEPKR